MATFETTVTIQAPPSQIIAVLCDIEHWPEWTTTVTSARFMRASPGLFDRSSLEVKRGERGRDLVTRESFQRALRDFLFGALGYEYAQTALELRASLETIFIVATFGDLVGVPVLPPYYGLRLLPFVVPQVASWKRRLARERDLGDSHEYHLHGM